MPDGTVVVLIIAVAIGYLSARIKPPFGLLCALFGPPLFCYLFAYVLMSPRLNPGAEPAGGWDLVATIIWTCWSVPISIVTHVATRWRNRSRKGVGSDVRGSDPKG
jgi:hypothetical protein